MKLDKKLIAVLMVAIVIVAAVGIYALSGNTNKKSSTTVTIAVANKNCYEPWWIADSLGYFADEGVDVKYMVVSGGGAAATALLSGQVDLAGMGADPMIKVFNASNGDRIVARWQLGETFYEYAVRKDSGINLTQPTTLIGKRIGMDTTTGYYSAFLSYLLDCQNNGLLTADQVESIKGCIVHTEFSAMVAALIAGSLDYISGGSYNSIAVANGNGAIEIQKSPYSKGFSVCLLASESALGNKSAEISKVLKALQRACDYINDNDTFQNACQIVVDVYGGTWTVAMQASYYNDSAWGLDFNQSDVNCLAFAYSILYPNAHVNISSYFEPKFLEEIKQGYSWGG